jgi:2,4-dienoyl-CoA reductase-like NADH-dependent reductase (Old Yellow Enzyme family)
MALGISGKVSWSNVFDVSLIHVSGRDMTRRDQVAEPLRAKWVDLIVIGRHSVSNPSI